MFEAAAGTGKHLDFDEEAHKLFAVLNLQPQEQKSLYVSVTRPRSRACANTSFGFIPVSFLVHRIT